MDNSDENELKSSEDEYESSQDIEMGDIDENNEKESNEVVMNIEEEEEKKDYEFWKILEKFPNWKSYNKKRTNRNR